jgi:hypothetical protein
LVRIAFTGEERLHLEEFSENAADGPDVDVSGIFSNTEQKFRSAVPKEKKSYNLDL